MIEEDVFPSIIRNQMQLEGSDSSVGSEYHINNLQQMMENFDLEIAGRGIFTTEMELEVPKNVN
jgi:hypothetical protein